MHLSWADALAEQAIGDRDLAAQERDWISGYVAGRLLVLAFAIAALLAALVIMPALTAVVIAHAAALIAHCSLGLLLVARREAAQTLAAGHAAGLFVLAMLLGGEAALPAAVVLLAFSAERCLVPAPVSAASRRLIAGTVGLALISLFLALQRGMPPGPTLLLPLLLPTATAACLVLVMRRREARESMADSQARSLDRSFFAVTGLLVLAADRAGVIVGGRGTLGTNGGRPDLDVAMLQQRGMVERCLIADRPALLRALNEAVTGGRSTETTLRLRVGAEMGVDPRPPQFASFSCRITPMPGEALAAVRLAPARERPEASGAASAEPALGPILAEAAHELRTPFNAAIGFTGILASPMLASLDQARIAEYAALADTSLKEAFEVSRQVLDLARIAGGAFELAPRPVAPADIIDSACDCALRLCPGLREVRIDPSLRDLPEAIVDPRALSQLMVGLVVGLHEPPGPALIHLEGTVGPAGLEITARRERLEPAAAAPELHAPVRLAVALADRLAELTGCSIAWPSALPVARLYVPLPDATPANVVTWPRRQDAAPPLRRIA